MSCKVASFPIIEDFSHFEGVSPLPFPDTFPSWPTHETKSESHLPGLEQHENLETPVLISYSSVKEPHVLFSYGSGKEPSAFLSFVSGKDTDMSAFTTDLSITVNGTYSSLPPTLSVASFTQSSSDKPSVTGSQFSETLLLPTVYPVVKQEPMEDKTPIPTQLPQPTNMDTQNCSASEHSDSTTDSSSDMSSSSETVASSPDSSSSYTLLSLLDGDNHTPLPERKTKTDRKATKRDREEKKQPQKRGRKKRNSDESDGGSEFDSNDSGCWAESKKERNKKAASNYRKRRKMYVGELEAKVATLTEKSSKDRASVVSMTSEMQILKERIEGLENLLIQHNVELPKKKTTSTTSTSNTKSNKRAKN